MFQEALEHLKAEFKELANKMNDRIFALEESQKTVVISAKKSLEVAIKVQRRQETWEEKHEDRLGGSGLLSEPSSIARLSPPGGWCAQLQTRGCQCAALDSRITEQERRLNKLDTEVLQLFGNKNVAPSSPHGRSIKRCPSEGPDGMRHSLEARLESGLMDMTCRLNNMQLQLDQQVLAPLWKISNELPAVVSRQEALAKQSHGYATKLGRQEVLLKTLANRLDACPNSPGNALAVSNGIDVANVEERELAGRVDAHSLALSEIYEQLKCHSEQLGSSRGSSASSLMRNREPNSTTASSRNSSRGCLGHHRPPPKTLSARLGFSQDGPMRGR